MAVFFLHVGFITPMPADVTFFSKRDWRQILAVGHYHLVYNFIPNYIILFTT